MRQGSDDSITGTVFSSALGWMSVSWEATHVTRIGFSEPTPQAALAVLGGHDTTRPPRMIQRLVKRLQRFCEGARVDFSDVPLELAHLTPFQSRVVQQCRCIPYGTTLSYADLAARAGSPRAARAVGNVMATNRFPLVVPCHRVVGARGALGGYSARDGLPMKVRLLRNEGSW